MFAFYSLIAKQLGRVADDLMGNFLEYEWARYSLLVIADGIDENDSELKSEILTLASTHTLQGEALALKLYDVASQTFQKAKTNF